MHALVSSAVPVSWCTLVRQYSNLLVAINPNPKCKRKRRVSMVATSQKREMGAVRTGGRRGRSQGLREWTSWRSCVFGGRVAGGEGLNANARSCVWSCLDVGSVDCPCCPVRRVVRMLLQ